MSAVIYTHTHSFLRQLSTWRLLPGAGQQSPQIGFIYGLKQSSSERCMSSTFWERFTLPIKTRVGKRKVVTYGRGTDTCAGLNVYNEHSFTRTCISSRGVSCPCSCPVGSGTFRTHRVKRRHRFRGHDTIAILRVHDIMR